MPVYRYKHPKSGELVEIVQSMNDIHEYIDKNGIKYERQFESVSLSKDQSINPYNAKDFARKTRDKNYNLGEMWKISKELSEKRKSISGKDEIKEKHLVNKYDKRIKNNENRPNNIKKNTN